MTNTVETSRYHQLANRLRGQMQGGALKPGHKLPSYAEMRRQGISQNTVEKAYALLQADDLIQRSNGSGVYVSQPSRVRTGVIGLMLHNNLHRREFGIHLYNLHLLEGARQAAKGHGMHLMLFDEDMPQSAWRGLDGVLMTGVLDSLPVYMPRVRLLRTADGVPSVIADDSTGITAAMEHLIQLGHHRIAYLLASEEVDQARHQAYMGTLQSHGIEPQERWSRHLTELWKYPGKFVEAARIMVTQWLHEDWNELGCTALLCQNDQTAIGALQAFSDAGIAVPDEVSVVGFDGTEAADLVRPHLTSVEVPLFEIGQRAGELLWEQISGENTSPAKHVALATRLRIGDSSAPARIV